MKKTAVAVAVAVSALGMSQFAAADFVKDSKLIVYEGAPHGITDTHKDRLNADLLAFAKS